MTCLLGFVALATDVGIMMRQKRMAQTAADAAAIAGAMELQRPTPANVTIRRRPCGCRTERFRGSTCERSHGYDQRATVSVDPAINRLCRSIVSIQQPTIFMGLFGYCQHDPCRKGRCDQWRRGGLWLRLHLGPKALSNGITGILRPDRAELRSSSLTPDADGALDFTGKAEYYSRIGRSRRRCQQAPPDGTPPSPGIVAQSDPLGNLTQCLIRPKRFPCSAPSGGQVDRNHKCFRRRLLQRKRHHEQCNPERRNLMSLPECKSRRQRDDIRHNSGY